MPKVKLYQSKNWLTKKYEREKLSEEAIAKLAGTTVMTINRWLRHFNLKHKRT